MRVKVNILAQHANNVQRQMLETLYKNLDVFVRNWL
jgi:hypothetical protein